MDLIGSHRPSHRMAYRMAHRISASALHPRWPSPSVGLINTDLPRQSTRLLGSVLSVVRAETPSPHVLLGAQQGTLAILDAGSKPLAPECGAGRNKATTASIEHRTWSRGCDGPVACPVPGQRAASPSRADEGRHGAASLRLGRSHGGDVSIGGTVGSALDLDGDAQNSG